MLVKKTIFLTLYICDCFNMIMLILSNLLFISIFLRNNGNFVE